MLVKAKLWVNLFSIEKELEKLEIEKKEWNQKITFGKYKSKKIDDILKIDSRCVKWCLKQNWFKEFNYYDKVKQRCFPLWRM